MASNRILRIHNMSVPVAVLMDPTMAADAEIVGEITNAVRTLQQPSERSVKGPYQVDGFGTPVEHSPRGAESILRALPAHERAKEVSDTALTQEMEAFRNAFFSATHMVVRIPTDMRLEIERNGRPVYVEGDVDVIASDCVFVAVKSTGCGERKITAANCTEVLVDSSSHGGDFYDVDFLTARFAHEGKHPAYITLGSEKGVVRTALRNTSLTTVRGLRAIEAVLGNSSSVVIYETDVARVRAHGTSSDVFVRDTGMVTYEAPIWGQHAFENPDGGDHHATDRVRFDASIRQATMCHRGLQPEMMAEVEAHRDVWAAANSLADHYLDAAREAVKNRITTPLEAEPGDTSTGFTW